MDRDNRIADAEAADPTKSTLISGNGESSGTRSTSDADGGGDHNSPHIRSETLWNSSNTIKVDEDEEVSRSKTDHGDRASEEINIQGGTSNFNPQHQPIGNFF